jgi:hypothetical protein
MRIWYPLLFLNDKTRGNAQAFVFLSKAGRCFCCVLWEFLLYGFLLKFVGIFASVEILLWNIFVEVLHCNLFVNFSLHSFLFEFCLTLFFRNFYFVIFFFGKKLSCFCTAASIKRACRNLPHGAESSCDWRLKRACPVFSRERAKWTLWAFVLGWEVAIWLCSWLFFCYFLGVFCY